MNIRFLFLTIITLLYACSDGKKSNAIPILCSMDMSTVKITLDEDYYHSVTTHIIDTSFVILKENNQTMFSNVDKMLTFDDTFYVLDRNSLRTVVSFNRHGEPKAKFGRVGQAPGEYVFPWDMDIDETGVYILDTNSKKVIHYNENGVFLKEQKIAFYADAFRRLDNGNYLFNATPNGKRVAGLILTDSLMNPIREFMPYPEGYVGGCNTSNIFRTKGDKIAFYRSPSDTVTIFNGNGEIKSSLVFDFSDKTIPEKAKIDYLAFRRSRHSSGYIRLADNPITVSDSLWIGLAEDGESQYTIFFNPTTNQCGCRKLSKSSSAYDMIEPMFSDRDNSIVSLLSAELENLCKDYKSLPDSVTEALNDGDRVLMVNGF